MVAFSSNSFPARQVRSLCWRGDELVDWVGGGRSFALDGKERPRAVNYAYRFDAATASPDGRFAVIYERLGTKGLLLDNGKIVRELNRSFYSAHAYEYPVALFPDSTGRLLLAHCPTDYCRIEFDDIETGCTLTASNQRKPADFFHSRLAASPNGKRFVSAGWIWHPWNAVVCFEIAQALADPQHLDRGEIVRPNSGYEEASACWLDDDRLVVGGSAEVENLGDDDEVAVEPNLSPRGLAVYDVAQGACLRALQLDEPPGVVFAAGPDHILSLYRHPKLIELTTGKQLHVWTELNSGLQDGSIVWGLKDEAKPPPMAFDPVHKRFAIVNGDNITVIEFGAE